MDTHQLIHPQSSTDSGPDSASATPDRPVAGRIMPAAVAIAALLLVSAGIRHRMEAAVAQRIDATRFSPFPLKQMPLVVGPWQGKDEQLDPFIARKTGSTDYIMRRYTNTQTGAAVELLMLYGPAAEMGYHKPDACYPGAGYKLIGGGDARPIQLQSGQSDTSTLSQPQNHAVGFKHLVFQRGEGGLADRQQVYYVWRYSDNYALEIGQPSVFGRLPGMFKIQVSRPLAVTESADGRANAANPCEDFLAQLMSIFELELAQKSSGKNPRPDVQAQSTGPQRADESGKG